MEGALVDYDFHTLRALAADDRRPFDIRVAGPSALLISEAHKISDRNEEPQATRLVDKDGFDVLRLLRGVESRRLTDGLIRLRQESVSARVTDEAITLLADLFGPQMTSAHRRPFELPSGSKTRGNRGVVHGAHPRAALSGPELRISSRLRGLQPPLVSRFAGKQGLSICLTMVRMII